MGAEDAYNKSAEGMSYYNFKIKYPNATYEDYLSRLSEFSPSQGACELAAGLEVKERGSTNKVPGIVKFVRQEKIDF